MFKGKMLPDINAPLESKLNDIDSKLGSGGRLEIGKDYSEQVQPNDDAYFVVSLIDTQSGSIPAGDITAGVHDIRRVRDGVTDDIALSVANSVDTSRVYFNYNFAVASWNIGDLFIITMRNIAVVIDGETYNVKNVNYIGRVTREASIEGKVDDVIVDTTQIISDVGDVDTAVGVVDGKVDDLLDRGIFTLDGATDYIHATGGEQDIVVYTPPSDEKINVIKLTLAEMTQSAVFRIYVSGQEQNSGTWTHGTSPTEFFISMADMILNEEIKVSWEPTAAEGADRNIPWSVRGTR